MNSERRITIQVTEDKIRDIINAADEYFILHFEDLKKLKTFTDLNDITTVIDKLHMIYSERIDKMLQCKDPQNDYTTDDLGLYFFIHFIRSEAIRSGFEYVTALEEMTVIKKEQIN